MYESFLAILAQHLYTVWLSIRSIVQSMKTALPYLVRWGELRKEVTEGYPDPVSSKTADDLPPRSRGLLFNDIDRCTGCLKCEKVCPVQCIQIAQEQGADVSKIWISVFDIDFSRCMFCGLCVQVCEPNSLIHTRQYEAAAYTREDLVASFGRGIITQEQKNKWSNLRNQDNQNH